MHEVAQDDSLADEKLWRGCSHRQRGARATTTHPPTMLRSSSDVVERWLCVGAGTGSSRTSARSFRNSRVANVTPAGRQNDTMPLVPMKSGG